MSVEQEQKQKQEQNRGETIDVNKVSPASISQTPCEVRVNVTIDKEGKITDTKIENTKVITDCVKVVSGQGGKRRRKSQGKRGGRKSKRRSSKKARKSKKSKRRRGKKSKRRRRRK